MLWYRVERWRGPVSALVAGLPQPAEPATQLANRDFVAVLEQHIQESIDDNKGRPWRESNCVACGASASPCRNPLVVLQRSFVLVAPILYFRLSGIRWPSVCSFYPLLDLRRLQTELAARFSDRRPYTCKVSRTIANFSFLYVV